MDAKSLFKLFRSSRLFSSLEDKACRRLLTEFSLVDLSKNEILFAQGDASDNVYLLISGRLAALLTTVSGEVRTVGYVEPGDPVGELGAVSDEPRTLTVRATKDSHLLKLSAKKFIELCHQYPAVMFATVHPIIQRSRDIIHLLSASKNNKHIVIVAANEDTSLALFERQLQKHAMHYQSLLVISEFDKTIQNKKMSPRAIQQHILKLSATKKTIRRYVYIVNSPQTSLGAYGFKRAEVLYIAAMAESAVSINAEVLNYVNERRKRLEEKPNLILIYPEDTLVPKQAAAWLKLMTFNLYHQIRLGSVKDLHRVLRFIRGRAVGVVLGGGGARGWGHLGAIKALRASKIPIDIIGGTSVGAVVAACYASSQSYDQAYKKFYKIIKGSEGTTKWYDLTWPAISLFSGINFSKAIMEQFGEVSIEEMWLPYFCISTNLATASEVTHTSGLLWQATRASTSIPGLIPPMVIDGELHMDGGLLNNLPVDVMRQFVGLRGKIVAVELNSFLPINQKYHFPPMLGFKELFLAKIGLGPNLKYKFPNFLDTFMRSMFVSSIVKDHQNSLAANVFINLEVGKYRLLNANPEHAEELINLGFEATMKQIKKSKKVEPEPQGST